MRFAPTRHLHECLPHYGDRSLSYQEVGATAGPLPPRYAHLRRRTFLGDTPEVFARAAAALMDWRMHQASGLAVATNDGPTEGSTVVLGLGRPVSLVIPCRVIYVVDEPDRQGFAYGTITDHPERGEELFNVSRGDRGETWLDITAFSRPASRLVAVAGPLNRLGQLVATRRYEKAVKSLSAR